MKGLVLFFVVFLSFTTAQAKNNEGIKSSIKELLKKPEFSTFSGVLHVSRSNIEVINVGKGLADIKNNITFSEKTLVPIGSITKQFTGAAILKMEMQGLLSTKEKVSKYIPLLTGQLTNMTIHELLTHTAGITTETGADDETFTSKDLIAHLNKLQLTHPRGEYHYSNLGYSLLGLIVENISGMAIEQYLFKNMFQSIGMLNTGYYRAMQHGSQISRGYLNGQDWGYLHDKNWGETGPYWNLRANGGMYSTVLDLQKWVNAIHHSSHLSDVAKQKFFGKHVKEFEGETESYYGYGWVTEVLPSGKVFHWHDGGNGIFSADIRYYPSSKLFYFIAGNRSDGEIYDLSDEIHNLLSTM